jgi:hypothetical protein
VARIRLRGPLLAAAVCAGLLGVGAPATATTGAPGTYAVVTVRMGDGTLRLSRRSTHGVNVVAFIVRNDGRRRHQFQVGRTRSGVLRPGQVQDVQIQFDVFGRYRYRISVNGGARTRGVFTVAR